MASETQHIANISENPLGFAKFRVYLKTFETMEVLVDCVLFSCSAQPNLRYGIKFRLDYLWSSR